MKMRKWHTIVLLVFVFAVLLMAGCNPEDETVYDVPPAMLQIADAQYHMFFQPAELEAEPEITGHISRWSGTPYSLDGNDSANFDCVGCPYAFVEGELVLRYEGKWFHCERTEAPEGTEGN